MNIGFEKILEKIKSSRNAKLALAVGSMMLIGILAATVTAAPPGGTTRTYYIAADEVEWNYAPTGSNQITGSPFGEAENVFYQSGPDRIGGTYTKAIYREYTDNKFNKIKERPEWLGTLGPIIRGQVGDTIKIVFKNNARFPFSMHPHGVFYNKDSEGAPYSDGTSGKDKDDDAVPPGGTHTYTWFVPERAGPGPNDPSSIMWAYHSHTDETKDTNSGLVGPMIITRKGMARSDGSPTDVDKEFVTLFTVSDENTALYIDANIQKYITDKGNLVTTNTDDLKEDEDFGESNLMHVINGYGYGNLKGLDMKLNSRVRWYAMGIGTEVDLHTPHWHGNTGLFNGMRTDVIDLLPMSMKVLDMVPDNSGEWLFHCHVNDHIDAGMITTFTVTP